MHIALAGNIGSGKSTLTKYIGQHYNWHCEVEDVENNPYLSDFYGDMKKWAFHLQIYFLNSRFVQVQKIKASKQSVVQDRTIYEDAYIFADNLYETGLMDERDYLNYLNIFKSMVSVVQPPDLLIYLRSDMPKLVERIQKRGRVYEDKMQLDYLRNLNRRYDNWIRGYKESKLLIVDMNKLDFVERPEDFAFIVERIDREIHGLFS